MAQETPTESDKISDIAIGEPESFTEKSTAKDVAVKRKSLLNGPIPSWAIAILVVAAIATGGISLYTLSNARYQKQQREISEQSTSEVPQITAVSALGRLEPQGEVITVSAPGSIEGERLEELLVDEGDKVVKDRAIAILDSRDLRQAAVNVAQQQVRIAQARLAQVRAGAKGGDIAAREAAIARLEAELPRDIEVQGATIERLDAQLRGDIAAQQATIERLDAQLRGDIAAQQATIERLKAQLQGDIAAQQATIERLEAERRGQLDSQKATLDRLEAQLKNAEVEYRRHEQLYIDGAISASLFDSRRLEAETAREQLREARATLAETDATSREQIQEAVVTLDRIKGTGEAVRKEAESTLNQIRATGREQLQEARVTMERIKGTGSAIRVEAQATLSRIRATGQEQIQEARSVLESVSEVRNVDVRLAQTEVEQAIAALVQAQVELERAYVKSPIDGQVLKINTRSGEAISSDGIVEIGRTDRMYVVAEIYETDIGQVRVGQRANITADAFEGELQGIVEQIGLQIGKKDILDTDPAADVDARVVEVKIRLDKADSEKVSGLTNLQVEVKITI